MTEYWREQMDLIGVDMDYLNRLQARARRDALEEAAKACIAYGNSDADGVAEYDRHICKACAKAIRALIQPAPEG